MHQDQEKLRYWIGFSKVPGIGPARLRALLDYYGDIETAWCANPGELRAIGLDRRSVESLVKTRQTVSLEAELDKLEKLNITVLTWDSSDYPKLLKNIPDPPITLYVRGRLLPNDEWAVGVVGTRRASTYGKESTRLLVSGLVNNGVTIVSGLAYGIDTQAHRMAVEQGGRTIAVLGCSVELIYPSENKKLAEIILNNGAIVSEYPLGTQPESGNFPRRNRIISGLTLGVLFVEGGYKSGARITVDYALEQGREVMAVPGSILRKSGHGANFLIQNGAKLVTSVEDILEELNLTMISQQAQARAIIPDNPVEASLLAQLSGEPVHIDNLGQSTGLSAAEIAGTLTMMELKGMVRQVGSMSYVIAHETKANYTVE